MNGHETIWTMSGAEIVGSPAFTSIGGTVLLFLAAMVFVAVIMGGWDI